LPDQVKGSHRSRWKKWLQSAWKKGGSKDLLKKHYYAVQNIFCGFSRIFVLYRTAVRIPGSVNPCIFFDLRLIADSYGHLSELDDIRMPTVRPHVLSDP
jgi:hypothetical protein